MRKETSIFLLVALFITLSNLQAQMTPEEVVQKQLESYNNRDIDAFMSVMDSKIAMYDFATGNSILEGYEACEKIYTELFDASPELHSKIVTRTVFGNTIIDHEYITGRKGSTTPIELVLIYEVGNEKIIKMTVLKKEN